MKKQPCPRKRFVKKRPCPQAGGQAAADLLHHLPCLCFSKDAETGAYTACNQAFADYAHRHRPEEVVGLTDAQIFDPDTAVHFVGDDRKALSMEEPYVFFEDVPDASGSTIRHLRTTKQKFTDGTGRLCTLGMCLDLTEMVQENSRIRASYEKVKNTNLIYSHIAQTLALGYIRLFYVNLDTESFLEYVVDRDRTSLGESRRGSRFFDTCRQEAPKLIYPRDLAAFRQAMDRDHLMEALRQNKSFVTICRRQTEAGPAYVSIKVTRMESDDRFIIIGVTDIDEQVRQRRAAERMQEERMAYARLNALTGDFLCVYLVEPETGRYREYSATEDFQSYSLPREGTDFFAAARAAGRIAVYPRDLRHFLNAFTSQGVLKELRRRGIFVLRCRLMIDGKPTHVHIKAAMVQEKEGPRMVVGINNIDTQVQQEQEYARQLAQAQSKASTDALTGVKNKMAFLEAEAWLDRRIAEGRRPEFAMVVLDVNGLKQVNDTDGHQAGDAYLQAACRIICGIFQYSPVFRVGGDEFAVIAQGQDYSCIHALVEQVDAHNLRASAAGEVVIACGMALYEDDSSAAAVFQRADHRMYQNKSWLKSGAVGNPG